MLIFLGACNSKPTGDFASTTLLSFCISTGRVGAGYGSSFSVTVKAMWLYKLFTRIIKSLSRAAFFGAYGIYWSWQAVLVGTCLLFRWRATVIR
jgi:hypothetical protein